MLVSPSGGGKSTIAKRLFIDFKTSSFPYLLQLEAPRNDEINGVHYHFLSNTDFNLKIENNDFLEWEEFYGGNRYGTLRSEVDKKLKSGYFCFTRRRNKRCVKCEKNLWLRMSGYFYNHHLSKS